MSRSIRPCLPAIACYHAEIHVQRGDEILTLEVDRPDWAPESEVVADLAATHGAKTVGDIVVALERDGRVRVEPENFECRLGRKIYRAESEI